MASLWGAKKGDDQRRAEGSDRRSSQDEDNAHSSIENSGKRSQEPNGRTRLLGPGLGGGVVELAI